MTPHDRLPPTGRDLRFSGWLDTFRWVAAAVVFYSHVRCLFLASLTDGQAASAATRLLYVLSYYGHAAVMVFFVLSGFLVGGTVVRAVREGRWSWRKYALQRGTRLYVVLVPALLLTLAWDAAEAARTAGVTPNDDTAAAVVTSSTIRDHTSPAVFAGNVAFVQTILVPSFGSNTPLWSLANEFWYYVVFPLLWLGLFHRGLRLWVRAAYLVVAAGALVFVGREIALYFLVWLLGCAVWLAPEWSVLRRAWPRRAATAVASVGFLAALLAVRVGRDWGLPVTDSLLAVTFALLLYCLKHDRRPAVFPTSRRVAATLADFSYTLYLVHLPPLIFLRACFTYETAWTPGPTAWGKLLLILLGVAVYAYVVSLVTERQTDRVRRWLEAGGRWPSPGRRAEGEPEVGDARRRDQQKEVCPSGRLG